MERTEWETIKALFEAALERPPEARAPFLAKNCSNVAIRRQVEKLLFDHEAAGSFLDESVLELKALPNDILNQFDGKEHRSTCVDGPGSSYQGRDFLIGQRVGAYQLERLIGRGGMASVYLAIRADAAYQKHVAIKIIHSESASDEILDRFRNERQTLASLDHSNIVRLLDGGSTEQRFPYLVMDYVEGQPIDIFCDSRTLSIEQRLDLFCKVCAGVQHAHDHQVIHRDLKPGNILVTTDGTPKLLDFGIAKVLNPSAWSNSLLTQTGTRRMTPAYASPEQIRGESVKGSSDVYSLGVVLYELLTGHRPYHLKYHGAADFERAICEEEPESPSTAISRVETATKSDGTTVTIRAETVSKLRGVEPGQLRGLLRGDLDNVVLMALEKEPSARYASPGELAEDIRRHLQHLPVTARPSTPGYRALKFMLRHRPAAAAVSLMIVITLSAIAYASRKAHRAEENAGALLTQLSGGRRSIAVLGFENVSGNRDTAWLSTALSEMLTTELAGGQKLRAISGEDVARMKIDLSLAGSDSLSRASLARVYKNLGSDYVIVGSYLDLGGPGGHVRLDVRLQDALRGETIAALAESGTEAALPELVSKVGADLRKKLDIPQISASEAAGVQATLPSNQEAARLYSEGLARLRYFDALGARSLIEKAIAVEPNFALAHSALAMAWLALGHDQQAKQEAKYAFELSGNLSREDRLVIEARYRVTTYEWNRAVQIYATLFEFFPDSLEYGLRLAEARVKAGQAKDAVSVIQALHSLPPPLGDDPRIDLEEATYSPNEAALARALEKAIARGERTLEAQALMRQGELTRASGKLADSIPKLESAKSLFLAAGDQNSAAQALHEIAIVQAFQNSFQAAQQKLEEALATYRLSGNEQGQARALNSLGNVLDNQGDIAGSKRSYEDSLAIYRRIQDRLGVANVLNNWANVVDQEGDLKSARRMFEEVLGTYRDLEDRHGIAMASTNLGMVLYEEGNLIPAKKLTLEALKSRHEISEGVTYLLATLGKIQQEQGMFAEARKNEEEAEALRREMGEEELEAESLLDLALLAIEQKYFREAALNAKKSAEALHKSHALDMEAYAYAVQAEALVAQHKPEQAREAMGRSVALSDKAIIFNIRLPLSILLARLRAALSDSDPSESDSATRALQNMLNEATAHGFGGYQFDASLALGEIEIKFSTSRTQGLTRLAKLERDAKAKGFTLIARKASAARRQPNG